MTYIRDLMVTQISKVWFNLVCLVPPNFAKLYFALQASKFQIECTCPSGKWIVKITCPNVPFICLKYIKPMQIQWKSKIHSRPSDKSCRYSTCPTVIFTHLRRSDEWNFEPCIGYTWYFTYSWWGDIKIQPSTKQPWILKWLVWYIFFTMADVLTS